MGLILTWKKTFKLLHAYMLVMGTISPGAMSRWQYFKMVPGDVLILWMTVKTNAQPLDWKKACKWVASIKQIIIIAMFFAHFTLSNLDLKYQDIFVGDIAMFEKLMMPITTTTTWSVGNKWTVGLRTGISMRWLVGCIRILQVAIICT